MNTGDVSGAVTLDSVNSVTFTQDTDGNIILHCAQNGEMFGWCRLLLNTSSMRSEERRVGKEC